MSLIKSQGKIVDKNLKENSSSKFNNVNLGNSSSLSGEVLGAATMTESTIKSALFE